MVPHTFHRKKTAGRPCKNDNVCYVATVTLHDKGGLRHEGIRKLPGLEHLTGPYMT